jgi:hypothetical protein
MLTDFTDQRTFTPAHAEDMFNPVCSANGDIRNGFAILGRVDSDAHVIVVRRILSIQG